MGSVQRLELVLAELLDVGTSMYLLVSAQKLAAFY